VSIEIIEATWSAPKRVRALCTTRQGGYSKVPYDSFNLAAHVGEGASNLKRNREFLRQSLKLPGEPCWLEQTHSTDVVKLDREDSRKADAAITSRVDTVAVVMIADCLPILLCNRAGTEVAAVHAGWSGLVDGVVQAAVEQMESPANQLLAWIGPAISQPRFEVGEEVRNKFLHRYAGADEHFVANRAEHWLCDLPGLAMDMLKELGVSEIHDSKLCSYSDETLFFSYRRNNPTGRMASLIWIDSGA
jgi:hypothetical protein